MSTLTYFSKDTIPKNKVYSMIHKCKKCPYITKSCFFINNHVRRHLCAEPLALFDCSKSNLQCFICGDCDFQTHLFQPFRNHIINHSVKSEDVKINLQKLRDDTSEATNEMDVSEGFECKPFLQSDSKKFRPLFNSFKDRHTSFVSSETNRPELTDNLEQNVQHMTDENIKCCQGDHCSYKTEEKFSLLRHVLANPTTSKNDKMKHCRQKNVGCFCCDECSFKSKWKCSLRKHIIKKHLLSNKIVWFHCDHCSYKAKVKDYVRKHTLHIHAAPENVKWFQCDHCSYKAKVKEYMQKHVLYKHTAPENVKWFQCDHCSYKAKEKKQMQMHKLCKHTAYENINWFRCGQCSYKAKIGSLVRKHALYKHNMSPKNDKCF